MIKLVHAMNAKMNQMTVTISLKDWKKLNMETEVFKRLEAEMYEIWQEAFGIDVKPDLENYITMYEKLQLYWAKLTQDDYKIFEVGYNRICQSLGNSILMFNIDWPEQDDLIYNLIALIFKNKDCLTYKLIMTKIRNERLEQDFE